MPRRLRFAPAPCCVGADPHAILAALVVGVSVLAVTLVLATRGNDGHVDGEVLRSNVPSALDAGVVARCVARFLDRPTEGNLSDDELARYVRRAYCEPFTRRGWVHADGTFELAAYTDSGTSECEEASPDGTENSIPCPPDPILDCALLDFVRRREAQAYIRMRVAETGPTVRCDDGRPLADVGAT